MSPKIGEQLFDLETIEERIVLIQQQYEVLNQVEIVGKQVNSILGKQFLGRLCKGEDGYVVETMGDDDMHGYLSLHEILHVLLEEMGRTFDIEHEDIQIREFLFELRNFVNDFLIETEILRQCDDLYSIDVGYTKNQDILGNLRGHGNAQGYIVFMNGLLNLAISELYPSIKTTIVSEMFSKYISIGNQDKIIETLNNVDLSTITGEQYKILVSSLCVLFTGSDIVFKGNTPCLINTVNINHFIKDADRAFQQIKSAFKAIL